MGMGAWQGRWILADVKIFDVLVRRMVTGQGGLLERWGDFDRWRHDEVD